MKKIQLTNGGLCIVDDEDYPLLDRHTWHKEKNGNVWYAYALIGKNTKIAMHRVILGAKLARVIDHINHDGMDNRKENLRFVTISHNTANARKYKQKTTSKYKGVWKGYDGKFYANINCDCKRYSLGKYESETDAAKAYDKKAIELFGANAATNVSLGILPTKAEKGGE